MSEARSARAPAAAVSLFGAARTAKPAVARTYHKPVRNAVLPVGYTTLSAPAPLADQVGVYLPYRPSRIVFDAAGEHPTALVESVAMGSIPAPVPAHIPHLPERTVSERMLSSSQLETVIYAGHAWSQMLPGRFKPDKEGVGLTLNEDGRSYRKGFFLGDGTGAGKGRQVAACVLDSWLQCTRNITRLGEDWFGKTLQEAVRHAVRRSLISVPFLERRIQLPPDMRGSSKK